MPTDDPKLFLTVFPFFFAGVWLLVTTMLGFMSGWFNLQQWYPDDGSQDPLLKLRGQSGSMGAGVALNGILRLSAYKSGLGVGIWRIFGPFQRPLLVPWSDIEAQPSRTFFTPMVKLSLGRPAVGSLKISAQSWSTLVEAAGRAAAPNLPTVPSISGGSVARGMFFEWLAITSAAATFFYVASRSQGAGAEVPIEACIGLPAVVIGIGQLVRFARQA